VRPRSRRGNQAIEFALVVPLLLILISGIVDLGQYMYVADGLVNSIAQGGRQAALADQDDGESPTATATTIANASWAASELPGTLTVTAALSGAAPDQLVVVTGTVPFSGFFGFLTLPSTISYTSTVRLMYQPD
jgi:Flp pilus assembly protein TadG